MSSWWIQLQQMKFLIQSLYNIGADLYNAKELKQASVVFELCCRCAWARVSFVCNKRTENSGVIHDDWSEEAVSDFVTEACSKCVNLLDALHQCEGSESQKNRIVIACLVNWSAVASSTKNLGCPTFLMRKWVKIRCKDYMDVDTVDNAPTIYSLLCTSSTTFEERAIRIILEQELLAYEEMEALNTNLCQSMQLKIIDILVHNVYVTTDYVLKKSTTLIKKGRIARARGTDGLNNCIECLSEAISELQTMNQIDVSNESPAINYPISYNLAQAFFLRALCNQEAQPNSEIFFEDIPHALKLWSSINWSLAVQDDLENGIRLLCCIADLVLLKGYFYLKNDIFQMLITLLERNSVPPKKCFAMLWADRRLTHALCTKPIDECVISSFAHHFSVSDTDTVGFWVSCIENSQALLVGLRQKFSLYDFISPQVGHCHPGSPLGSNVTVDEVREVVSTVTSSVSTINYNFLVGHLYYDLCERLISSGQLIQALSCATEALDVRTKLLHKKFICTFGKQPQSTSDTKQDCQQNEYSHPLLEVIGSVASEVWPHMCSENLELRNLSQWNVLRCYLESILQVGSIHEALGNASIAEAFLVRGKDISYKQGLPIFRVAFSSALGEIYCKKQLWDMAETELNSARQILVGSNTSISCKQCILTLEVTLDQRFGCLFRNRSVDNNISATLDLYKSALDKLKHVEWDISSRFSEEASQNCSRKVDTEGPHLDIEYKRSKRASKQVMKERNSKPEPKTRMTRSRSRPCNNKSVNSDEAESQCNKKSSGNGGFDCPSTHENERHLELNILSKNEFGCAEIFVNNRRNFGKRLLVKVMEGGKVQDFIYMKWEIQRRRLSLRLLNELGTCIGEYDKVEEVHKIFWQSFGMLLDQESLCQTYSGPHSLLLEFIEKESQGDIFTVECALLLYNLSWFSLKTICSRNACCDLSRIQLPLVVSLLLKAFILSREVPFLFQKVSRLLATLSLISTSCEPSCLPLFPGKTMCGSRWAAFFHQASLGTYFNHQLCSNPNVLKLPNFVRFGGSQSTASTETLTEVCDLLRSAPGRFDDLEKLVNDFYQLLPSITVICVSLLGSDYASLLSHLLPDHFSSPALLLLSRLNSDNDPIVVLLQSDVIPEDMDHNAKYITLHEEINSNKEWHCPWGCTVVDEVAPQFKLILKENYLSSSFTPTHDTQDKRHLWWEWRRKLNDRLDKFVRSVEEAWLGPWKCLLLGERLDSICLDSVVSRMTSALKRKYQFDMNENLLRVILGGAKSVSEIEKCISQMLLHKGCITSMGIFPHKKCDGSSIACAQDESLPSLLYQLVVESGCKLEVECDRQSIIMVLDSDVQMLPWENLPTLKKTEVYRMPSVVSICALINVNIHRQEQSGSIDGTFPSIDPLDAFYLLNPSGDLDYTQVKFEEWFRDQKLEGKAGTPPSVEELFLALKSHDLFIYFGHGSGAQYIPGREIQKLDNCAATLLMGCSSGCLSFMGSYNPQGVVLSYLLAGSPAIIANLWEVTDKDIDRFGKAMLSAWLVERSTSTIGFNPRNLVEEFESMNIAGSEENGARDVSRSRRFGSDSISNTLKNTRCHRPKIGSFMSQAREACVLPVLIGASPVCYGVPTGIWKKKNGL
ncbi:Separase [Thalictrum thalictroides]|uniref:separase n=1 Tax=Thalictrum thalictroides TaxID=46969 RepID=A0A7J6VJ71_THATH|nr:Separase [Thalictrum thalictroides]